VTALPQAVVVIGASGFVGRNLVDALAGRVSELIGVTGSTPAVPGCTRTVRLSELGSLPPLPEDTVVAHLGAYRYDASRFDLAQSHIIQANTEINSRIYHLCAERGLREVRMASSVAVYGADLAVMDDAVPVDLNAQPNANEAFYAWSKRWAEILAGLYRDRFGINSVVFRLSNPYGPHDSIDPNKAHVAPAFVMKALSANPVFEIRGDGMVQRDFVFVGDVVEALVRSLAWRGRHDVFNLCTGRTVTLIELAETVMRVAGVAKPICPGAPGAFGPASRASRGSRIKAATGIKFTHLEDGMRPTVEWYRHALNR
jgi:UDP-glucose 4-epimerase